MSKSWSELKHKGYNIKAILIWCTKSKCLQMHGWQETCSNPCLRNWYCNTSSAIKKLLNIEAEKEKAEIPKKKKIMLALKTITNYC